MMTMATKSGNDKGNASHNVLGRSMGCKICDFVDYDAKAMGDWSNNACDQYLIKPINDEIKDEMTTKTMALGLLLDKFEEST